MKRRLGYKGYVLEARAHELRDGGFSAEFSVEEHDARGVTETQFYVPNTFATQESAIEAAIQAGEQKIDRLTRVLSGGQSLQMAEALHASQSTLTLDLRMLAADTAYINATHNPFQTPEECIVWLTDSQPSC